MSKPGGTGSWPLVLGGRFIRREKAHAAHARRHVALPERRQLSLGFVLRRPRRSTSTSLRSISAARPPPHLGQLQGLRAHGPDVCCSWWCRRFMAHHTRRQRTGTVMVHGSGTNIIALDTPAGARPASGTSGRWNRGPALAGPLPAVDSNDSGPAGQRQPDRRRVRFAGNGARTGRRRPLRRRRGVCARC